jgi:hypothetical protein
MPASVAISIVARCRVGQGLPMYRWVYWSGVAVFVFWAAFSAYSVFKGF